MRVEVAAFVENSGTDILLKSSGFIDLAVYYEGYLAEQNGRQAANSVEERYKKLIQSQNGEQEGESEESEESMEDQLSELLQSKESMQDEDEDDEGEEDEDEEKVAVDKMSSESGISESDGIHELGL